MSNRAAAGANRAHVNRRGAHRDVADRGFATQLRLAVLNERDVRGGAAHIKREQVVETSLLGNPRCAGHAAGRTTHEQVDRQAFGNFGRGHAAVGAQDVQFHILHLALEFALEIFDVHGHFGSHVGVGHRGNGALVLLHLRYHVRRQRYWNAWQRFFGQLADFALGRAVGVAVDQRDGKRLDVFFLEILERFGQRGFLERAHLLAVGAHALVGLNRARQWGQRIALVVDDPAAQTARHVRTRDLQNLFVTLGGHQAHFGTGAGQHRVGGHGRAVHDLSNFLRRDAGGGANALDAVEHADGRVFRGAGYFCGVGIGRLFVHQKQVGKRAPDIDS